MEVNDSNNTASDVARAISVAMDWNSTSDARRAAFSFIESVKGGDARVLASTALLLVKSNYSAESRLFAFKMLQHLVRMRWEELSSIDRRYFANLAVDMMSEVSKPCEEWAVKSQTAALVVEIVRREGLNLWQELLPTLIILSSKGPLQAELVAMTLRWLPEDVTVHNEDLIGDRRRVLLRGLTQSLSEIFPVFYSLLERHFGAMMNEIGLQQLETAKQHASAVTATLNAINAYAEWSPLQDLSKYGIIHGCGFLLSTVDFRLHSCEFFKLVSSRKRPIDSSSEFDSIMMTIFQLMVNISGNFFQNAASKTNTLDGSEVEFAECLCEVMASLGSTNLQCIYSNHSLLKLFLHQMLGFFQHYKLVLHYQSLLFWLGLIRDLSIKPRLAHQPAGDDDASTKESSTMHQLTGEKSQILTLLSDDICSAILDVSFLRMGKKDKALSRIPSPSRALELWCDDFEGKCGFSQYRSKLSELVRLISSLKPLVACARVSERIIALIKSLSMSTMSAQDSMVIESMQAPLEVVVSAVFDNDLSWENSEARLSIGGMFEGLLEQFLSLNSTEASFVEVLAHCLDAFGPFLKHFPKAVGSVIRKLFNLLSSLPVTPYLHQDKMANIARHARLQICMSFIRLAKSSDKSVLPHMKDIADTMAHMQREGLLLRSEHNLLGEAFLVMASATGGQQQQDVLAWLLDPLIQQWTEPGWQITFLSEPLGLVHLCSDKQFMWSIYHAVTFFEKALKRSRNNKGNWHSTSNSAPTSTLHPMASHVGWMLPPLLKLLRVIHSLWSPSIYQILPGEMKSAMIMSDGERNSLLGEGHSKVMKGALSCVDGSLMDVPRETYVEANESDLRNWLKGVRESAYNVLGLSMTIGDTIFKCLDIQSVSMSLIENIQSMEYRHIRQLIHSVLLYLVKHCPQEMWEVWVAALLHPLFIHVQQFLQFSWSSLLLEGRAKVPDALGIVAGSDMKIEVIEEKLLRDLTREVCSLLSVIASPGLNTGLPSSEQSVQNIRTDPSSLKDLHTYASSSMVGYILGKDDIAAPVCQICYQSFTWTDGEAVTKVSSFCNALVLLAVSTNSLKLLQFASKDLFLAVVQGLELESNAVISSDLIGLCRDIFIYLRDRDPTPRYTLLSCTSPQDLAACEEALAKTSSPKEQRQLLKSLLATRNRFKALASQKSVNVVTNVTPRSRDKSESLSDDTTEPLGLAAIL